MGIAPAYGVGMERQLYRSEATLRIISASLAAFEPETVEQNTRNAHNSITKGSLHRVFLMKITNYD